MTSSWKKQPSVLSIEWFPHNAAFRATKHVCTDYSRFQTGQSDCIRKRSLFLKRSFSPVFFNFLRFSGLLCSFPAYSSSQGGAGQSKTKQTRAAQVTVDSPSALSLPLPLFGEHQTLCGLFHAPCSPLWLNASRGFLLTSAF